MRFLLLVSTFILTINCLAQKGQQAYKVHKLKEEFNQTLNGGFGASLGGRSRNVLSIDLPVGTVYWCYAIVGSAEPQKKVLDLEAKISEQLSRSGFSEDLAMRIDLPAGNMDCDIEVMPRGQKSFFEAKVSYSRYESLSKSKIHQACMGIALTKYPQFNYDIGIRNPSQLSQLYYTVEVIAITKETSLMPHQLEALSYNKMSSAANRSGNREAANSLNKKSIATDPDCLPCLFTRGLLQLSENNDSCLITYSRAISLLPVDADAKNTISNALDEVKNLKSISQGLKNYSLVLQTLKDKNREYIYATLFGPK